MKSIGLWLRASTRNQGSRRLWREGRLESGASAVEYGLLIAGIAAMIAVAVFAFGGGSTGMFQDSCKTIFEDNSAGSCS
jgi:pilus assembly protein Flp/PilA